MCPCGNIIGLGKMLFHVDAILDFLVSWVGLGARLDVEIGIVYRFLGILRWRVFFEVIGTTDVVSQAGE